MCVDSSGNAVETIFDIITLSISICDVIMAPYDVSAWICLGADFIDLIPFITGVGEYAKLARYADKASEAYSKLKKASSYGIASYKVLKKELRGTGLEAHHIIEKRLVKYLNINPDDILSVALTKEEHRAFTNAWRKYFEYGMDYSTLTKEQIMDAAIEIYAEYPELIGAAYKSLYG